MHWPERHVHTNDHQPEVPRAEPLIEHLAEHLRPPVVKAGEQPEDRATEQHVMEVGDDVVRVGLLGVTWCHRVCNTRQATDREQQDESDRKLHRGAEHQLAAPHGERPVDDFDSRWNRNGHRCHREHCYRHWAKTRGKHVVGPHTPPDEADCGTRKHHERIAKQWLATEHRQHLRDNAERRQDEHVDLGVAKDPEQVLPQQRVGTCRYVKELGAETALKREQEQSNRDDGNCEQQQELHDECEPGEHRHLHQSHSWCPHVEHGHDQVDCTGERRNAGDLQTKCPEVDASARREHRARVGCVHEPATIGGTTEKPGKVDDDATSQKTPESEGVDAWEGNVASPNLQWHEIVCKAGSHRHHEQKHHRGGMHRKHLVVQVGIEYFAFRCC